MLSCVRLALSGVFHSPWRVKDGCVRGWAAGGWGGRAFLSWEVVSCRVSQSHEPRADVSSLPVGTSVRIAEPADENLNHAVGFVVGRPGEEDIYGDRVPEGMIRVEFRLVDPAAECGIRHREAFSFDAVEAVYC